MLANIGTTELIIIIVILLLFFGSSKLKEIARGLGKSTKEVKNTQKEPQSKDKKKDSSEEDE